MNITINIDTKTKSFNAALGFLTSGGLHTYTQNLPLEVAKQIGELALPFAKEALDEVILEAQATLVDV